MTSQIRSTSHGTRDATARLAKRSSLPDGWWREMFSGGPLVGRYGFGTYRIADCPEHRGALFHALRSGLINLLDTAANYTDGESEEVVGDVIRGCLDQGVRRRDELVVVSKVGHFKAAMLRALNARAPSLPADAVVRVSESHAYSLCPEVVSTTFEQSRQRLKLACLDGYLVHDPGYLLSPGPKRLSGLPRRDRYQHLMESLYRAFQVLEGKVQQGRLRFYGISADGLRTGTDPELLIDLGDVLAAAKRAGGAHHHLKLIQFPFNPLETEASSSQFGPSLISKCRAAGLVSVGNRPLNAHRGGFIVRLASPGSVEHASLFPDARVALASCEAAYPKGDWPHGLPRWSTELPKAMRTLVSTLAFDDFYRRYAIPITEDALGLHIAPSDDKELAAWRTEYRGRLERLMASARAQFAARDVERLGTLYSSFEAQEPSPSAEQTWAQRALSWQLGQRDAPDVALVGMRLKRYVDDVIALAEALKAHSSSGSQQGES